MPYSIIRTIERTADKVQQLIRAYQVGLITKQELNILTREVKR